MTKKRLSMGLVVSTLGSLALALAGGCGSEGTAGPYKDCGKDGFICDPPGFPFVQVAAAVSDSCSGLVAECAPFATPPAGATTAHLSLPKDGTICLDGTIETGGWVGLVLPFSTANADGSKLLTSLNADRLGITQFTFTVDSPLTGGITMSATTIPAPPVDCPDVECFTGFDLMTAPGSGMRATFMQPGAQVAPFGSFEHSPALAFDTTSLEGVGFNPAVGSGDYAFCISDLRLRDAAGNEVTP